MPDRNPVPASPPEPQRRNPNGEARGRAGGWSNDFFYALAAIALGVFWVVMTWRGTWSVLLFGPDRLRFDWGPLTDLAGNTLVAVLAVLSASVFLGRRLERQQQAQLDDALVRIDLARKEFFAKLPDEQKTVVVREFFQAICPGVSPEMVDEHVRYLMKPRARREDFVYAARLAELPAPSHFLQLDKGKQPRPGLLIDPKQYLVVHTQLRYRMQILDAWRGAPKRLYATICLTAEQVNAAFDDPDCVYREQLLLSGDDPATFRRAVEHLASDRATSGAMESIAAMDPGIGLLKITVKVEDKPLGVQMRYDPATGIRHEFWLDESFTGQESLGFELGTCLPYGREMNSFIVVFASPTQIKSISFDARKVTDDLHAYEALTVMDASAVKVRPELGFCTVNVGRQWVQPTSGIFFWWPVEEPVGQDA